ncbi:MAG: isopeptide-forming domain-containing fimbrial protein [Finegoldia magna]|uniref:isopeptide-forming domain-containing fimbrial protein n=1 Tax=Finegoldia magna TaxID=1260 RepID=UPI0026F1F916|nr:isopeptide-forming domain-containing fimbrial protein [Finegoldia magna]MDU7141255.1 isopeptide-forming domain-containing fimbrial protein [Finegoldia magna]
MKKRFLSLIIALAMMVGVFTPLLSSAAQTGADATEPTKVKVNVHKILISQKALDDHDSNKKYDPTKGVNVKEFFGDDNAKEINGVFFVAIKEGEAGYADFDTKTREEQDAILKTATRTGITGDKEDGKNYPDGVVPFELDNPGNYKIYEVKHKSTYKGPNGEVLTGMKAIPVDLKLPEHARTEAGVQKEIHVYPKNSEKKVKFDKNFAIKNGLEAITDPNTLKDVGAVFDNYNKEKANAKAEVGKEIKYEAKAFLPKGSIYKNLHLADSMDSGLKYDSKKGVTVTVTPTLAKALDPAADYTVKTVGNGFDITFNQTGLDKLNNAAKGSDVEIKFEYSATVTSEAVVDKPMDNHATFTYNHTPPEPSSDKLTPVDNKINVEKTWAEGTAPTDITVKYVLLDADMNAIADVTFKKAKEIDGTDLGNGITFERTGDYKGTFKGLEKGKEYRVKEIVNGYEPEYKVNSTTGTVTVKNTKTNESITPTPPQVTVGGKKFVKVGDADARLAGAQFIIQNNNEGANKGKFLKINEADNKTTYATAEKAYNDAIAAVNEALAKGEISATNKVTIAGQEYESKDAAMVKVGELKDARDKAFREANLSYTWVKKDENPTVFTSNDLGQFEVKGLEYGDYQAVEIKAPAGYALPTDGGSFTFTVEAGSYKGADTEFKYETVLKEGETQTYGMKITNTKVSIPQTGGIGTIIFTAIGLAIMASAIIAIKKRQATEAR